LLLVFGALWFVFALALCVFAVFAVVSVVPVLATAGMVNENTTNDANSRLSSFFMYILLVFEFVVRSP
jgi:hypothetical protein